MNIYIAFDSKNNPVSLIACDDDAKAEIVFTSMNLNHVVTEKIDINDKNIGLKGVIYILGNKSVPVGNGMGKRNMTILKRGL